MYMMPRITSGVTELGRKPEPIAGRPPRLPPAGAHSGSSPTGRPAGPRPSITGGTRAPAPEAANPSGRMWYTQATFNRPTLSGVIFFKGEKRMAPESWPYVHHSFAGSVG